MSKLLQTLIVLSVVIFVTHAYVQDNKKTNCVGIKVSCFETDDAEKTVTKEINICHTSDNALTVEDYIDLCPKKYYPGDGKKLLCSKVVSLCGDDEDLDVCNTEGDLVCKNACDECFDAPDNDDDNTDTLEWVPKKLDCTSEEHFEQESDTCYSNANKIVYSIAFTIALVFMFVF